MEQNHEESKDTEKDPTLDPYAEDEKGHSSNDEAEKVIALRIPLSSIYCGDLILC